MIDDELASDQEPAQSLAARSASRRDVLKAASALAAAFALGGVTFDSGVETAMAKAAATATLMVEIPDLDAAFPAQSFQFGVARGVNAPGGGSGRDTSPPSFSDIVITKAWDQYTALLQFEAVQGDALSTVAFVFRQSAKGSTQVFGTITISDVYVSSSSLSSGGDLASAGESLSFNFGKIEVDMGGNAYAWDLTRNASI